MSTNKTPYEIRLELLIEARHILQARAANPAAMPSQKDIIEVAKELNGFISTRPDGRA